MFSVKQHKHNVLVIHLKSLVPIIKLHVIMNNTVVET